MVSAGTAASAFSTSADFRMAVILADLEDFSYKEIAEIMECPAGTVMSRLYRGRKILQELLYDYAVEQGIIQPQNQSGADKTLDLAAYRRQQGATTKGGGAE
jgi:RNA polymerase sigma-70 factor (ECF subfamily)